MKCIIYSLVDPRDRQHVRYVGKTIIGLSSRLKSHLHFSALKSNTHRNNWIKSLLSVNIKPEISMIEEIFDDDVNKHNERERYWIRFFKNLGYRLVNGTEGGDGVIPTEETRLKISIRTKEAMKDPEIRRKISLNNTGRKQTPETIYKRIRGQIGRHHTEEHNRKIAESNKISQLGKKASIETRRKMSEVQKLRYQNVLEREKTSNAMKGIKKSEDTKKKMREAKTPDIRKRISVALTGIKRSEETRQKMKASYTPERRKRISDAIKGIKRSRESIQKTLETKRRIQEEKRINQENNRE